ncbi:DUF6415 family natural product biosynthesis protein [Streptomyces bobili]|uniref:DUF6415 family natural product biosynthesis protein n=1 Tax=Streptomyces bobili TaxID=67280 RepID=UPI00365E703E
MEDTQGVKMTIRVYKVTCDGMVTPPRTTVVVPREGEPASAVEVALMRGTAEIVLGTEASPEGISLSGDEVVTLTQTLRGHLDRLVPEVERAAQVLDERGVPRHCALACVGEARGKLRAGPNPRFGGDIDHARRLARVLKALCEHHESFSGGRL